MKRFLSTALILFIGLQLTAQTKISKVGVKEGLLWEISGKDLKESSYLFGTYHLVGKDFTDTLPGLLQAFKKSKVTAGEVLMESEMEMAQKMMPFMLLQNNTLDKILTVGEFKEVDSFLVKKSGLQLSMLNGLKPAAVQLTLISFLAPKNISSTNPALDMFFQTEGRKAGKEVIGLETIESQAGLLFNSPLERQKELLLKTVRESDRMVKESQKLYEDYRSGDLNSIERSFAASEDWSAEERTQMLSNRNKNWAGQFPSLLTKGPVFIAVGAGHLPGKDGLIELLRTIGYTVRPVSVK